MTIRSIADLIGVIGRINWKAKWFRGQSEFGWTLKPSLLRRNTGTDIASFEKGYLRRFQQESVPFLPASKRDDWEWMFLMQHYNVPTRLLDWSESPLVALYFSVFGMSDKIKKKDGAVWCLDPIEMNREFKTATVPCFGVDKQLEDYLNRKLDEPPEKPPLAILAQRQFARLQAQQGVFVMFHKETMPLEKRIENKKSFRKLKVPATSKIRISKELRSLGITKLSLFPELDQVGKLVGRS